VTIATSIAALIARWTSFDPALAELLARLIAIAVTAVVLWASYVVVTGVVDRVVARHAAQPGAPHGARLRTVASLLANLARWFIAFVSVVIVLRELGVDVQALIVSAGIVGVALAFGASRSCATSSPASSCSWRAWSPWAMPSRWEASRERSRAWDCA